MSKMSNRNNLFEKKTDRAKRPPEQAPFLSNDELLEAARQMLSARLKLVDIRQESNPGKKKLRKAVVRDWKWSRYWHRSFKLTKKDVSFCRRVREHRLSRIEREILVTLVLNHLGLLENNSYSSCGRILSVLGIEGTGVIQALRAMTPEGTLMKSGLIAPEDTDTELKNQDLIVDPDLIDNMLEGKKKKLAGWSVKTEKEFFSKLPVFTEACNKKQDVIDDQERGYGSQGDTFKAERTLMRVYKGLCQTLKAHPKWKISRFLKNETDNSYYYLVILLVLLGKELGHFRASNELFKGGGLARVLSDAPQEVNNNLLLLCSEENLIRRKLIQPCGGNGTVLSNDLNTLRDVEFELTDQALKKMDICKRVAKKRSGEINIRKAKMRLKQVVLSDDIRKMLEMSIAQARNSKMILQQWGLGDIITYGRSVTLLFSGPPGVGKTACAEGFAHELKRPILVADYSDIQSCWIGATEKNIVRVFREAKESGAVLFWDEADAMFSDRNNSTVAWEARDLNVLLQELEKFEGVCILATNRKTVLDKALERRISLKIDFNRPDETMRLKIWKKMLPRKMPLAKNVDIQELAKADLSGGEIKNVVLNTARLALTRQNEKKGKIRMEDFRKAIELETEGKWGKTENSIGF